MSLNIFLLFVLVIVFQFGEDIAHDFAFLTHSYVKDVWPPEEVRNDKRHRDFETKPRRWMDEGDETDPSNAPSDEDGEDDD